VGAPSAFQRHHRVAPERSANESARCRGRERVVTNLGREFGRFGNLPVALVEIERGIKLGLRGHDGGQGCLRYRGIRNDAAKEVKLIRRSPPPG
jgi:hypothetical protein